MEKAVAFFEIAVS